MDINYNALKYITGYDLTSEEKLKENGIKNISMLSNNGWKTRLIITKNDNTEEIFDLDYTEYIIKIRKDKIQKIINKTNG